jgi:membrane-bound lytic murein transglycosylase A
MIAYARCFLLLMFALALALTGCAKKGVYAPGPQPPDRPPLQVPEEIHECSDDLDAASLLLAIDRSLKYYDGIGRIRPSGLGKGRSARAG